MGAMKTPIQKLIAYYGSANKTADALNKYQHITRQSVDLWVIKGYIPFHWGITIEEATKGEITAAEICIAATYAKKH